MPQGNHSYKNSKNSVRKKVLRNNFEIYALKENIVSKAEKIRKKTSFHNAFRETL